MGLKTGLTASAQWRSRVKEKSILYYLQGSTIKQAAARISFEEARGVSFSAVHKHIRAAIDEYEKASQDIITQYKARELAKIDNLEAQAWAAFQRSCQPIKTNQVKNIPLETPKGKKKSNLTIKEETETIRESAGDKRFLDTVQWCIDKRLEIMATMAMPAADADKPGAITTNTTIRQIIFRGRTQIGTAQVTTIVTE
jgi:hypothetical protein